VTGATACAAAAGALVLLGASDALRAELARMRALPSRRRPASLRRLPGAALAVGIRAGAVLGLRRVRGPDNLADRVLAAGYPGNLRARDWVVLKLMSAAVAALAAVLGAGSFPGRLGLAMVAAAPAAGYVVPDFWLARSSRRRGDAALRELPYMLDLLRVTVGAGSSPVAAMGVVAQRFDGPLAAEWRAAAAAVALGVSQDAALSRIARRLPVPAVGAFAETLAYSNRAGLSLADALGVQAAAARHARCREIRDRAARAGPKMQLVVALVLVPSVMLTLGAVLAAELSGAGLGLEY
jgi:tight adherence protein C